MISRSQSSVTELAHYAIPLLQTPFFLIETSSVARFSLPFGSDCKAPPAVTQTPDFIPPVSVDMLPLTAPISVGNLISKNGIVYVSDYIGKSLGCGRGSLTLV